MSGLIPTSGELVDGLNHNEARLRLDCIRQLAKRIDSGSLDKPGSIGLVNNHIHTKYSFSPYYPAKAIWRAYDAGLSSAGIVDHDSVSGAAEFMEAGSIIGIATTIGFEMRVDFSGTAVNGRRINNPDQDSVAYVTVHGIPHNAIDSVKRFLAPVNTARNVRNEAMVERIDAITRPFGIGLDFAHDVLPLSEAADGGSVTERHILFALGRKMIDRFGKGGALVDFLERSLDVAVSEKAEAYLSDAVNPFYEYDLLGLLKGGMVKRFYVNAAGAECPPVREVLGFMDGIGAIPAYAYLGDVEESPTGDKKRQKFEDDYIELLFDELAGIGFKAVTYMPSRNSAGQLARLKGLCAKHGFLEICGEDINGPRQAFVCETLREPEFANLIDSTWAVIGHEKAATLNRDAGFFSLPAIKAYPDIRERIKHFKDIGLNEKQDKF